MWQECAIPGKILHSCFKSIQTLQDRIPMSSVIGFGGGGGMKESLSGRKQPHIFFCIYLELLEVWEILDSSWKINDMGEQMGEEEISWNLSTVINKEKSRKNFSHQSNEGIGIDNLWDYFLWGKAFHRNKTVLARRVFQGDFKVVDKIKLSKKFLKSNGILNVVRKQK